MTESHQPWDAQRYARNARFVADLGTPLLALLDVHDGEAILDLGCGDGAFTEKLVALGAVVVGIDSSRALVESARVRGLDVRVGDGERLAFDAEFDAVVSNAALHWMLDRDAVLAGVHRALRRGGRFVAEFGGHGNIAAIASTLAAVLSARGIDAARRFPWYFPTEAEHRDALEAHGFAVEHIALVARPTFLATGLRGWLDTFANPFGYDLDPASREEVFVAVETALAPSLRDRSGRWIADYVRLGFRAHALGIEPR